MPALGPIVTEQLESIIAEHLLSGAVRIMRDGIVVYVPASVAAKLIRLTLKQRFPKTTFSVRCQRAAGGLHRTIIVAWDRHADSAQEKCTCANCTHLGKPKRDKLGFEEVWCLIRGGWVCEDRAEKCEDYDSVGASAPDREWVRDALDMLDGYSYDAMTDSTIRREPVDIGRYTVQFEHWLLVK